MASISEAQILDSLKALASGVNLDPPMETQQQLARSGQLDKLFELHLWLVVGIALRRIDDSHGFQNVGELPTNLELKSEFISLCNVGVKGLEKAQNKWDPEKGYKFGTYASWWIRQALNGRAREVDPCFPDSLDMG